MTEIRVFSRNGVVDSISACGHADYADPGNDIVCAGVSTVFRMLTVGISRLLDRTDFLEIDEAKAFMRVSIPATVHSQAALLVESAVAVLREFEAQYSKYVHIVEVRS